MLSRRRSRSIAARIRLWCGISLTPTLAASPLAVTGGSDTHIASQWQIAADEAFMQIVHDSGEVNALTSYTLPTTQPLARLAQHRWRVRHKGKALAWSPWSAPSAFTADVAPGQAVFTEPGTHNFIVPASVTRISAVVIGGYTGDGGNGINVGGSGDWTGLNGGDGAVRIIWGSGRSFPDNAW